MMKYHILFCLCFILFAMHIPAESQDISEVNAEFSFDDAITIDGRTYKVSPDFILPVGIDKDSPVKLLFSEDTHELLSIERLIEDDSDSNELEYHFGIVNAITRSNTDLEYRVYVDGIGYLFTTQTRIDERIAFLEKYASVALVTKNGEAVMCRVLSSNTAIPEKDIFVGMVEQVREADDFFILTIDRENYVIDAETNTIGTVMIPGTWVFGYRINEKVRFISAITEEFPNPADVESFQGFVNFVGDIGENGSFYITAGDTTLRVLPDTAIKGSVTQGDYVSGFRINKDILLLNKPAIPFDKSRFEVYYQTIDDVVSVRDINSPTGQSVVSIILGEKEIEINSFTNVVGELKKGVPAMAVLCDGTAKIVVVCDTVDGGKVPVSGFISSITGTAPNYSLVIDGKSYSTSFATVIAAETGMEPGIQVAGIANRDGVFDLLTCYSSVLPESGRDQYTGVISKIAVNAFQIDDRVIDYDSETIVSGSFTEGKFVLVSLEGEYAEMIYILPDDYSDFNYHTASGVLSGIGTGDSSGRKAIRLDETVYYIDSDTKISRNLAYDEIGTVLYKGMNQVSIIDILPKPVDKGAKFSGKITRVNSGPSEGDLSIAVGGAVYDISPVAACIGFSDLSRLSTGANVEGYVYGNDILAVRMIRGAGLFGILNPPWVEYVLAGSVLAIILVFILLSAIRNRITKHTGSPEAGPGNTIILHEENGQINSYTVDESLFDYISCLNEKIITVRVRGGKIIEVQ
ncbi:MAG: hypothetical protein IJI41_11625 [Anaerolineaceae bacterium]|nr:hypothetical protein [Anaerolineaceae bacterium]MBR6088559.1 hypothetical protein [Anaerolineaceae bacterium]